MACVHTNSCIQYHVNTLPHGMIGLNTTHGQNLLKQTNIKNQQFVDRYHKQIRPTYCGPASLGIKNSLTFIFHHLFFPLC